MADDTNPPLSNRLSGGIYLIMAYNDTNGGSTAGRDGSGKFLPGHREPGSGRKPKAVERAYIDAIRNAVPPEELESLIKEALEAARSTNSWRGLVEVVELVMSYGAGKPTQRIVQSDGNLDALLAALADDTPLLPTAAPSPAQP